MDSKKCQDIRNDITALLWAFADIEKKHGVKVSVGNAKYGSGETTFQLSFSDIAADGTIQTKEVDAFKQLAPMYGLKAEDFGRTFIHGGKTFKIVGLKPRATRLPIIAEATDGKRYKFAAESVAFLLAHRLDAIKAIGNAVAAQF